MMNKRSSRLIAWLLTLVMVLNIAPMTALADDSPVRSNTYKGPTYAVLETESSEPVPDQTIDSYTVQYVIKGEYTYDGKSIVVKSYPGKAGNPSKESCEDTTGCSNPGTSTATWDSATRTFIIE